jgi:S-DNA-T family DNA segregation ATPase FtsK/SpoIIIE
MPDFASRPPRIQPELPFGEVTVPGPPPSEASGRQQLFQLALPLVTIIGYVFVSAMGQGRSMLLLIPMGLSVIASSGAAIWNLRRNNRIEAEKRAAYMQRLAELRQEMIASHDMQRRFYLYNYPDPDAVLQIAADRDYHRTGLRLWERRTSDSDFGTIRLGVGTRPSTVIYTVGQGGSRDSHDAQMKDALKLVQDSLYVTDVPVTIPLRRYIKPDEPASEGDRDDDSPAGKSIDARSAIGVAGADLDKTYQFIRSIMAHFVAFQAPTDARLFVVGAPEARSQWEWARWLPHCNTSRN